MLGLKLPNDYPKLISRCELPEDRNWTIWDNNGNLLYMNFNDKITDGSGMFSDTATLTSFEIDLPLMEKCEGMFAWCENLIKVVSNMSNVINGKRTFIDCKSLETFCGDLSSLTNGYQMFKGCTNLKHFVSDLSSMKIISNVSNYEEMNSEFLSDCPLETFKASLKSLVNGSGLLKNAKLDKESVLFIKSDLSENNVVSQNEAMENSGTNMPFINLTIGIKEDLKNDSSFLEEIGVKSTSGTSTTVTWKNKINTQISVNIRWN